MEGKHTSKVHRKSVSGFNAFSPFLQDISNNIITYHDNKENIPPDVVGVLNNSNNFFSECGAKNGWRNGGIVQLHNASQTSCFSTPIRNNLRPQHTGLTPGNRFNVDLRGSSTPFQTNTNIIDFSLTTEGSDMGEVKEGSLLFTPVKKTDTTGVTGNNVASFLNTAAEKRNKSCDFFLEPVFSLNHLSSPNIGTESTFMPKDILSDSEDDDSACDMQTGRKGLFTCKTGCAVEADVFRDDRQSGMRRGEERKEESAERFVPQKNARQSPVMRRDCPPPAYQRKEGATNVTRVVSSSGPLIAMGGRRVPIDKLHLFVRPAPLLPSARPLPSAVKSLRVLAPPASAPSAFKPTAKGAQPAAAFGCAVLEFARGELMRFQWEASQPPPCVGHRYLAAIMSGRSPYDNVAYEDVGFCVHVQRNQCDTNMTLGAMEKVMVYDGFIIRQIDEDTSAADIARLGDLAKARSFSLVECRKHFRFLNLPFELVDVCYTFDKSICIVYYSIKPQEGTSSQPNISRLLRMLQHQLKCKVYLKRITGDE